MATKYSYLVEIRNALREGPWEFLDDFYSLDLAREFAQENRKADTAEGIVGYEYRVISQTTTITQVVAGTY